MIVTQNVFDGRGTDSVPHKNTMKDSGNARTLAEATYKDDIVSMDLNNK